MNSAKTAPVSQLNMVHDLETRPQHITKAKAMYFEDYSSAMAIWRWTEGKVFYVPAGHPDMFRSKNEYSSGTEEVLPDAVGYLVLERSDGSLVRVSPMSWFVKPVQGGLFVYKAEEFSQKYQVIS